MSSDNDYSDCDEEISSNHIVKSGIKKLLKMSPNDKNLQSELKDNLISVFDLKRSLAKITKGDQRKSNRNAEKKKIEDCFRDITTDISTKLETMANVILGALDKINQIDARLEAIEGFIGERDQFDSGDGPSYASVASSENLKHTSDQVSDIKQRLDFTESEKIREKRVLQVCITHPSIDSSSDNLEQTVVDLLRNKLAMEEREIDKNMRVTPSKRENTIVVSFSSPRFKKFTFRAKKKTRLNNDSNLDGLFISDYLTAYNYNILNNLRIWKRERSEKSEPCYETVYAYEGKVYVKRKKSDNNGIYVKNMKSFIQLKSSF